jgi:hypothetical protein
LIIELFLSEDKKTIWYNPVITIDIKAMVEKLNPKCTDVISRVCNMSNWILFWRYDNGHVSNDHVYIVNKGDFTTAYQYAMPVGLLNSCERLVLDNGGNNGQFSGGLYLKDHPESVGSEKMVTTIFFYNLHRNYFKVKIGTVAEDSSCTALIQNCEKVNFMVTNEGHKD